MQRQEDQLQRLARLASKSVDRYAGASSSLSAVTAVATRHRTSIAMRGGEFGHCSSAMAEKPAVLRQSCGALASLRTGAWTGAGINYPQHMLRGVRAGAGSVPVRRARTV